ncbi:MAG: pilin [Candidatus Yanofskybacteria bacterium]|nr:pilin [Candidatus Yanofskybacteria bacterium]
MKFSGVLVILALMLGSFFISPADVLAGSAACGFNPDTNSFNPIAGIQVKARQLVFQGRDVSGEPIKVGTSVNLDATPVDSAQRPTNTRDPEQEPRWSILGPGKFLTGRRTDQCFLPRIEVTGEGEISVTVTMGTISGSIGFSVGGTLSNPNSGSSSSGSGGAESGTYCAYKNTENKFFCIPTNDSKEAKDAAACNKEVSPCSDPTFKSKGNTCVRKDISDCDGTISNWNGMPPRAPEAKVPPPPARDLGELIANVFNWSLGILGISVFVMIIYGGATWLVAAGSPGLVGKAKDTIKNALLGGVLLLSAYLVLNTINPDLVQQSFILPALRTGSSQTNSNTLPVNQGKPAAGTVGGACLSGNQCSSPSNTLVCISGTCQTLGEPGQLYGVCGTLTCNTGMICRSGYCIPGNFEGGGGNSGGAGASDSF